MAGVLIQVSEKDGGIGEVLLLAILVLAVVAAVGCMMMMFPILVAIRHGWRWMLATIAATSLAGWPLRVAFDSEEITHSWWGLISFPLWMAVAVVAWRGPPDWFPKAKDQRSHGDPTIEAR